MNLIVFLLALILLFVAVPENEKKYWRALLSVCAVIYLIIHNISPFVLAVVLFAFDLVVQHLFLRCSVDVIKAITRIIKRRPFEVGFGCEAELYRKEHP
jgi:uncharacterized protein (DUF58 family)